MRGDIAKWSRACMVCATKQVGKPIYPFLSPIPVSGPFDYVGVDIIQFPTSSKSNKYGIMFMNYLTKWPEVFPARNQNSFTIARLLVDPDMVYQRNYCLTEEQLFFEVND